MNKVYFDEQSTEIMTFEKLREAAGFTDRKGNLIYDMSRLEGNMCDCYGNGEFILLPEDDEAVIEGGKRYMVCRICGGHSHL